MMINRQWHIKEEIRKVSTMRIVCLFAAVLILGSSAVTAQLASSYGKVPSASEGFGKSASADEDFQVFFTEPIENFVTYPSSRPRSVTRSISLYEQELARCKLSKSKLVLSLILNSQKWQDIDERQRNRAMHRLSKFFAIPKEYFTLDDISRNDMYEMLRNTLRKGPNHLASINSRKLGRLSFVVGCNNVMFPTGKLIASQIGEQMSEELIADITDLDFDWWSIWTERLYDRMKRTKRDATEGSGDYYDYDGEGDDEDPDGGVTEVPANTTPRAHRHHHGDTNKQTNDRDSSAEPPQNRIDSNGDDIPSSPTSGQKLHVHIDLSSVSNAGSTASTDILLTSDKSTTTSTSSITTNTPIIRSSEEEGIDNSLSTLDPALRESVSILESDINKTIENNDKKLMEEQARIERILQQKTTSAAATSTTRSSPLSSMVVTSSERSSYDLSVDFVTPIIETIPDDERIEVIQTNDALEFNLNTDDEDTTVKKINTEVPIIAIDEARPPQIGTTTKDLIISINSAKGKNEDTDKGQKEPEVGHGDSGGATTTGSSLSSVTTTEIAVITETTETATTMTTITVTTESGQVTTTAIPSAVDNTADATTERTDGFVDEGEDNDDDEYLYPEEGDKPITPSTPGGPLFSSTKGLNIFSTPTSTTEKVIATTEIVEAEIVNSPPVIKSRLPKQQLTAGKPFGFNIPMETFFDAEDGTNLNLSLFDKNDQPLKSSSWIQFDETKREIYGLPLEEVVSRWQYKLHATDKMGEGVVETLDLSVQQYKSYRSVNHEISISLKLISDFKNAVDWQLQLIRGIVELTGDSDMTNIFVREVRTSHITETNALTFVFTNDTLPKDRCPEEELATLLKVFDTTELNQLLAPEIVVTSITGQQIGNCQKINVVKAKPTPSIAKNYPPLTRNQVDRVNAVVGNLLVFQVPLDTFYDPEDKTDLKLSLLTSERKKLHSDHWLQFDSKNREFYGIPSAVDFGQKEYLLVAEDSEGLTATDALVVTVNNPKPRDYNAIIQLHMNVTVDTVNSPLSQRRFVERLAQVFGDADTSNIKVRTLPQKYNRGQQSTFSYTNASIFRMHNQQCPDEEIEKLRTVLLEPDGSLRDSVKITFGSEFKLFRAQFVPAGTCQAADTPNYDPVKPIRSGEKQVPTTTKDDYMLTFILPAAIILTMLLLGAIIACVLHRRRMTGKMELGDEEERRSFRSKGIPVIFHDELEEKPEIMTKSPIILKDEKPPLLPPSYNSTAIDGDSEDVDEYVPPPAVMMGNRENRGKSPVTPSYRKPPPYVSP